MSDFREFFDPRKLSPGTLGQMEFVLNSPAYEDAFKPYLKGVARGMEHLCRDRSQTRKDKYSDDFLYGGVCAVEGLLTFFQLMIEETDFDHIHESMASMSSEKQYDQRLKTGNVKPIVGVDQKATPDEYRPEEDF